MKNKQISENINASACNYIIPFIIAFIIGFIGGFCRVVGYRYNSYVGTMEPTPVAYIGILLLVIAVIFDLIALKAFLTDAHVKALEIFYGKERAVKKYEEYEEEKSKTNNNKANYGWQHWE